MIVDGSGGWARVYEGGVVGWVTSWISGLVVRWVGMLPK